MDKRRRKFTAMLREAETEAEREGTVSIESVAAEIDGIIDAEER